MSAPTTALADPAQSTSSSSQDDNTAVGMISDSDEMLYRVDRLRVWFQNNNLSLNVGKTKEIIVDIRLS